MTALISNEAKRSEALHPMAEKVCRAAARNKQLEDCTVEEARAMREERGNPFAPGPCELADISDAEIPISSGPVSVRIYRPKSDIEGLQPALLFFHGGGFCVGDIEQYDTVCQHFAFNSGCVVVSVEYQLAPERKIKAIHQEGFEVWQWLRNNAADFGLDAERIAIGGDSAGGNLTIGVELACKRNQFPVPVFQLLIYPSADLSMSFPSVEEFANGYFLTRAGMTWFRSHYMEGPEQASDPELDFLKCDLSGLSPAYLMTAGYDPLRDEGKAFADRLEEFAVPVEHECYTDMMHGFISFAGGIPAGMQSIEDMSGRLKRALA